MSVLQIDREAANPWMERNLDGSEFSDDREDLAKAFAAHREQAVAELYAALSCIVGWWDNDDYISMFESEQIFDAARLALTKANRP